MMEHYDQDIAASHMEVSPHNITYMSLLVYCVVPVVALLGTNQSSSNSAVTFYNLQIFYVLLFGYYDFSQSIII